MWGKIAGWLTERFRDPLSFGEFASNRYARKEAAHSWFLAPVVPFIKPTLPPLVHVRGRKAVYGYFSLLSVSAVNDGKRERRYGSGRGAGSQRQRMSRRCHRGCSRDGGGSGPQPHAWRRRQGIRLPPRTRPDLPLQQVSTRKTACCRENPLHQAMKKGRQRFGPLRGRWRRWRRRLRSRT